LNLLERGNVAAVKNRSPVNDLAHRDRDWFGIIFRFGSRMRFMGLSPEPVAAPHKDDKRFRDEEWEEHLLFDFIKQSYLITAPHIHDAVRNVPGGANSAEGEFLYRQFIDALSPTNFADDRRIRCTNRRALHFPA
jgi:hypothetical protein